MPRDNYAALQSKIQKEIAKLKKQAEALQAKRRTPAIASILRTMREMDISPEEIAAAYAKRSGRGAGRKATAKTAARPQAARTIAPKYRDPQTGATWTGRGKPPRWITEAEAAGTARDTFLIQA